MGKGKNACASGALAMDAAALDEPVAAGLDYDTVMDGVRDLARRAQAMNPKANLYEVGGSLRDELNGAPRKDVDVAVCGLTIDQLRELAEQDGRVEELIVAGQLVGLRLWAPWTPEGGVELALARTEVSTGPERDDFAIVTNPDISIEEDLGRRDFTCNALARNVLTGELIDPYNGAQDIADGVLRVVYDDAFRDDALRVMRGIARMGKDGSTPDPHTLDLMREFADAFRAPTPQELAAAGAADLIPALHEMEAALVSGDRKTADRLSKQVGEAIGRLPVSPERIFDEMNKTLSGAHAAHALRCARDIGLLDKVVPEMHRVIGYNQQSKYHDLWADDHILLVLQRACEQDAPITVRWAALLHDIGKPASGFIGKDKRRHFYAKPAGREFAEPELVRPEHIDWRASARKLKRTPEQLQEAYASRAISSAQLIGRGHAHIGANLAVSALNRMHAEKDLIDKVRLLVREHMYQEDSDFRAVTPAKAAQRARRFLARVGRDNVDELLLLRRCDRAGKSLDADSAPDADTLAFEAAVREQWDAPVTVRELAVNGHDFIAAGIKGPRIGELQREFLKHVIADPAQNTREQQLAWIAKAAR